MREEDIVRILLFCQTVELYKANTCIPVVQINCNEKTTELKYLDQEGNIIDENIGDIHFKTIGDLNSSEGTISYAENDRNVNMIYMITWFKSILQNNSMNIMLSKMTASGNQQPFDHYNIEQHITIDYEDDDMIYIVFPLSDNLPPIIYKVKLDQELDLLKLSEDETRYCSYNDKSGVYITKQHTEMDTVALQGFIPIEDLVKQYTFMGVAGQMLQEFEKNLAAQNQELSNNEAHPTEE